MRVSVGSDIPWDLTPLARLVHNRVFSVTKCSGYLTPLCTQDGLLPSILTARPRRYVDIGLEVFSHLLMLELIGTLLDFLERPVLIKVSLLFSALSLLWPSCNHATVAVMNDLVIPF